MIRARVKEIDMFDATNVFAEIMSGEIRIEKIMDAEHPMWRQVLSGGGAAAGLAQDGNKYVWLVTPVMDQIESLHGSASVVAIIGHEVGHHRFNHAEWEGPRDKNGIPVLPWEEEYRCDLIGMQSAGLTGRQMSRIMATLSMAAVKAAKLEVSNGWQRSVMRNVKASHHGPRWEALTKR